MVIGYSKNLCLHYHIRTKSRPPAAIKWLGISPIFQTHDLSRVKPVKILGGLGIPVRCDRIRL